MKNWSIGTRLSLAFGIIVAILIAMVWLSIDRMEKTNDALDRVVKQDYQKLRMTHAGVRATLDNARITMQIFLAKDNAAMELLMAQNDQNRAAITELQQKLEASLVTDREKDLFRKVQDCRQPYLDSRNLAKKLLHDGDRDQAINAIDYQVIPLSPPTRGHGMLCGL